MVIAIGQDVAGVYQRRQPAQVGAAQVVQLLPPAMERVSPLLPLLTAEKRESAREVLGP